jgi:uncharacterized protein YgbK (DUF1537 family)
MMDTMLPTGPLVAWYGDDYTGSAACMEVLTFAGLPSVLFLDPPSIEQAQQFSNMRGIGLAGTARSQTPEWMDAKLPEVFDWLKSIHAPISHYKICSTFDSSPHVGSIGRAIEIATQVYDGWMPLFPAAPEMRRYQAFGTLFASSPFGVTRLDRHEVMSKHPSTPMHEADVRMVLELQTKRELGLISLEDLRDAKSAAAALRRELANNRKVVAVDTVSVNDLVQVGALLWGHRSSKMLAVGSQGIEYALIAYWRDQGLVDAASDVPGVGRAKQMIAISGSASTVTADQISHASTHGFATIALDAATCLSEPSAIADTIYVALDALSSGQDILIYSAKGPGDPALKEFRAAADRRGLSAGAANHELGAILGRLLADLLGRTQIKRAAISGGDTSGHAARQLGIYALTALAPTVPGAALCLAHSQDNRQNGLQLALKGGQMGSIDYFDWIRRGGGPA